jgi:glycosyltransferase involved in cell wall biosynthesis
VTPVAPEVVGAAAAWWGYTYVGYPVALALFARLARRRPSAMRRECSDPWPFISICMAAHNEAATIANTIERTLALDYPADRRQILVISDGSTDGTDDIVRRYEAQGVELLRIESRGGKTAGENLAIGHLRGEIIVNTDATVIVDPSAIKSLVRAFENPDVGVASCRDISVAPQATTGQAAHTRSESTYVGYEMWIRGFETQLGGIVGASGCLYAARSVVQRTHLPGGIARDFAAPLIARGLGLRAVSVQDAVCYVPRSTDLVREFHRKRRTVTRGIATLVRFRKLLNPVYAGSFAWKLASHKVMRWLAPWWALAAGIALATMLARSIGGPALLAFALAACAVLAGTAGRNNPVSRAFAPLAFAIAGNVAVMSALIAFVRGVNPPVWEPTRRSAQELR